MNELIERIFKDFTVDGVTVPVSFMFYEGDADAYVTYMESDADNSVSGDDELIGYAVYFDFDIYSKGNYTQIIESIKTKMRENGFVWQPSRSSPDLYEAETRFFHKTLNFGYYKEV